MKILKRTGMSVLLLCIFIVMVPQIIAAPVKNLMPTAVPTSMITPQPIEYVLPYPGLLPTHPLYFIKNLRDRIIELLITDALSKAEFYLLQADKKLNMGVALQGSGKKQEADAAFKDALVSRGKAVNILESHFKSGNTMPGHLRDKLFFSLDKHREVLLSAGKNIDAVTAIRVKAESSF